MATVTNSQQYAEAAANSEFEQQHPRGQPENAGQFTQKHQSDPHPARSQVFSPENRSGVPVYHDTHQGPRWSYGFQNRPPGYAHNPVGFISGSEQQHPQFNFGTMDYPYPLTPEEQHSFELTPVYREGQTVELPATPITRGYGGPLKVHRIADGKAYVGDPSYKPEHWQSPSVAVMPEESLPQFFGDMSGQYFSRRSSKDPDVEQVRLGKAEILGKGDDGVAFGVGDKVVKMSTTVPYVWSNPGHRTPEEAAEMLSEDYATAHLMRKAGVPGIPPQKLVYENTLYGPKAFIVMPRFKIPEKLTAEQLGQVKASIEAMHKAGWTLNDSIQVGLDDEGNIWHFDTGKATKNDKQWDRDSDLQSLRSLYDQSGVESPDIHREKMEQWDGFVELMGDDFTPATESPEIMSQVKEEAEEANRHRRAMLFKPEAQEVNRKFRDQVVKLGLNPQDYFRPKEWEKLQSESPVTPPAAEKATAPPPESPPVPTPAKAPQPVADKAPRKRKTLKSSPGQGMLFAKVRRDVLRYLKAHHPRFYARRYAAHDVSSEARDTGGRWTAGGASSAVLGGTASAERSMSDWPAYDEFQSNWDSVVANPQQASITALRRGMMYGAGVLGALNRQVRGGQREHLPILKAFDAEMDKLRAEADSRRGKPDREPKVPTESIWSEADTVGTDQGVTQVHDDPYSSNIMFEEGLIAPKDFFDSFMREYSKRGEAVKYAAGESESPKGGKWIKLGGATVGVDDSGTIVAGCEGLKDRKISELDETADERADDQEAAEDAGWESAEQKRARGTWEEAKKQAPEAIVVVRSGDKFFSFQADAAQFKALSETGDGESASFDADKLQHHVEQLIEGGHRVAVVDRSQSGKPDFDSEKDPEAEATVAQSIADAIANGEQVPDGADDFIAQLAGEAVQANENISKTMRRYGLDPTKHMGFRGALAEAVTKQKAAAKPQPSDARQRAMDRQRELQAQPPAPEQPAEQPNAAQAEAVKSFFASHEALYLFEDLNGSDPAFQQAVSAAAGETDLEHSPAGRTINARLIQAARHAGVDVPIAARREYARELAALDKGSEPAPSAEPRVQTPQPEPAPAAPQQPVPALAKPKPLNISPEELSARHAASGAQIPSAPKVLQRLLQSFHGLRDTRKTGAAATKDIGADYAKGMHDYLKGIAKKGDGFGDVYDLSEELGHGALGYASPAGNLVLVPPMMKDDDWDVRYSVAGGEQPMQQPQTPAVEQAPAPVTPTPEPTSTPTKRSPALLTTDDPEKISQATSLAQQLDPNNMGALLHAFQRVHGAGMSGRDAQIAASQLYFAGREGELPEKMQDVKAFNKATKQLEELLRPSMEQVEESRASRAEPAPAESPVEAPKPRERVSPKKALDSAVRNALGPKEYLSHGVAFRNVVQDVWKEHKRQVEEHNGALREALSSKGGEGKRTNVGPFVTAIRKHAEKGDAASFEDTPMGAGFSRVAEFIARKFPQLLYSALGESDAQDMKPTDALFAALQQQGIVEVLPPYDDRIIGDALEQMNSAEQSQSDHRRRMAVDPEYRQRQEELAATPFGRTGWKIRYEKWARQKLSRWRRYARQLGFDFETAHPRATEQVTIGSTTYVPGEWIPRDEAAQATPAQAEKIEGVPEPAAPVAPAPVVTPPAAGTNEDLAPRVQAGDRAAAEQLIKQNMPFIAQIARKYARNQDELADLMQEGSIALLGAANTFDPTRGVKFSTFAFYPTRLAVDNAARGLHKGGAQLTSELDEPNAIADVAEEPTVEQRWSPEVLQRLEQEVAKLPERDAKIISMHFGFGGKPALDYADIGQRIGLSKPRVHQIASAAMQSLAASMSKVMHYARLRDGVQRYVKEKYPDFYARQVKSSPGQRGLFDEESHPRAKEAVSIGSTAYTPGEWIPKAEAEKATAAEAEKIEGLPEEQDKDKPTAEKVRGGYRVSFKTGRGDQQVTQRVTVKGAANEQAAIDKAQQVWKQELEQQSQPDVAGVSHIAELRRHQALMAERNKPAAEPPSELHQALAQRFRIPPEAVASVLNTPVEELRERAKDDYEHAPSNAMDAPQTGFTKYPLGTAKLDVYNADPGESYVEFLQAHNPADLVTSEPEDGIRKHPTFRKYVEWFKQGHEPPPITTTENEHDGRPVVSSNRRRVLAAQEAGVKSIKGWHAVQNRETGLPLKYKDVLQAAKEMGEQPAAPRPVSSWSPEERMADWKEHGVQGESFKAWFGPWDSDPANASKVVNAEGEPQETHNIPGTGSVVKDAEGKPIVVYHGTARGGFDAFDKKQQDADALYGAGMYFTEDKYVADSYTEKGGPGMEVTLKRPVDEATALIAERIQEAIDRHKQELTSDDSGQWGRLPKQRTEEAIENLTWTLSRWNTAEHGGTDARTLEGIDPTNYTVLSRYGVVMDDIIDRKSTKETKSLFLNIRTPFRIDEDIDKQDFANRLSQVDARKVVERMADHPVHGGRYDDKTKAMVTETLAEKLAAEARRAHVFMSAGGNTTEPGESVWKRMEQDVGKGAINELLAEMGYDGITHIGGDRMGGGHNHRVWIAFEPTQIKAVDNQGTFDESDQRMKYARLRDSVLQYVKERHPDFYARRIKSGVGQRTMDFETAHPRATEEVTIKGETYTAGEWIPKAEAAQATPEEAEKIEGLPEEQANGDIGQSGSGAGDAVPQEPGTPDGREGGSVGEAPPELWDTVDTDQWTDEARDNVKQAVEQLAPEAREWMRANKPLLRYTTQADLEELPPAIRSAFSNAAAVCWNGMRIHFMEGKPVGKEQLQHELVHMAWNTIPPSVRKNAEAMALEDGNRLIKAVNARSIPAGFEQWQQKSLRRELSGIRKSGDKQFNLELSLMIPNSSWSDMATALKLPITNTQYCVMAVHLAMAHKLGHVDMLGEAYRREEPAAYRAMVNDDFANELFKYRYSGGKFKPMLARHAVLTGKDEYSILDDRHEFHKYQGEERIPISAVGWDEAVKLADLTNEKMGTVANKD